MRAILLAAGLGTRLRPLTNTTPKCLMPLKGKPLLQDWLERLSDAGIGPFLVNTHYLPEQVRSFVESSPFRKDVTLVHETHLLGTAGTLVENLGFLHGEDGLLIHADNYSEADFGEFIQAHRDRPRECLLTMMTFAAEDPSSCGIVELDGRGVVVGFHEKVQNPPGNLANGAIYILSAGLIELLAGEWRSATDFSTEIVPRLLSRIYTYRTHEIFADIGSTGMYQSLKEKLATR